MQVSEGEDESGEYEEEAYGGVAERDEAARTKLGGLSHATWRER